MRFYLMKPFPLTKRAFTKCNLKFDTLTFISLQENSETVEIYFYSYHVIPLNKRISYYFVNQLLPILFRNSPNAIVST